MQVFPTPNWSLGFYPHQAFCKPARTIGRAGPCSQPCPWAGCRNLKPNPESNPSLQGLTLKPAHTMPEA